MRGLDYSNQSAICIFLGLEENCSFEEAQEIFTTDRDGLHLFWKQYAGPKATVPTPEVTNGANWVKIFGFPVNASESTVMSTVAFGVIIACVIFILVLIGIVCTWIRKKRQQATRRVLTWQHQAEQSKCLLDVSEVKICSRDELDRCSAHRLETIVYPHACCNV